MASFFKSFGKKSDNKETTSSSPVAKNKLVLLIIDPQNDFHPGG